MRKTQEFPRESRLAKCKDISMDTSAFYAMAVVYAYEWDNEYYYLISNGLSSCAMCEFYNYQGEKVAWTDEKIADFQKNAKRIKVVWKGSFINK
jgi:hypothetical protein